MHVHFADFKIKAFAIVNFRTTKKAQSKQGSPMIYFKRVCFASVWIFFVITFPTSCHKKQHGKNISGESSSTSSDLISLEYWEVSEGRNNFDFASFLEPGHMAIVKGPDKSSVKRAIDSVAYKGLTFIEVDFKDLSLAISQNRLELLSSEKIKSEDILVGLAIQLNDKKNKTKCVLIICDFEDISPSKLSEAAEDLRIWCENQKLPLIALGDFGFSYNLVSNEFEQSYKAIVEGESLRWLKPNELKSAANGASDRKKPGKLNQLGFINESADQLQLKLRLQDKPLEFSNRSVVIEIGF